MTVTLVANGRVMGGNHRELCGAELSAKAICKAMEIRKQSGRDMRYRDIGEVKDSVRQYYLLPECAQIMRSSD